MSDTTIKRRDEPLTSEDLATCNAVLKKLCRKHGIEKDREAVTRLATIIIGLQRQGIRELEQLRLLAEATME